MGRLFNSKPFSSVKYIFVFWYYIFLHVIEYTKRPSTSNALLNSNSLYGRNRFPTSLYKLIADMYEHSK